MTEQTDAEPIVWGKAYMRWTRYGYDFRVPLWAEERPLVECEEQLRRAISALWMNAVSPTSKLLQWK